MTSKTDIDNTKDEKQQGTKHDELNTQENYNNNYNNNINNHPGGRGDINVISNTSPKINKIISVPMKDKKYTVINANNNYNN